MKNEIHDVFPFKLGEQYDNWEFDLLSKGEIIENEISYEIYEFTGKIKGLFGILPSKIDLLFNADVLEKVIYYFEGNLVEYFEQSFSTGNYFILDYSNNRTVLINQNTLLGIQLGTP